METLLNKPIGLPIIDRLPTSFPIYLIRSDWYLAIILVLNPSKVSK